MSRNGSAGTRSRDSSDAVTVSSSTEWVTCTVPAPCTSGSRHGIGPSSAQSSFTVPDDRWNRFSDEDRKRVASGKRVSVRVDFGGRRINKTKNKQKKTNNQ